MDKKLKEILEAQQSLIFSLIQRNYDKGELTDRTKSELDIFWKCDELIEALFGEKGEE